jgi:hypothetical protein
MRRDEQSDTLNVGAPETGQAGQTGHPPQPGRGCFAVPLASKLGLDPQIPVLVDPSFDLRVTTFGRLPDQRLCPACSACPVLHLPVHSRFSCIFRHGCHFPVPSRFSCIFRRGCHFPVPSRFSCIFRHGRVVATRCRSGGRSSKTTTPLPTRHHWLPIFPPHRHHAFQTAADPQVAKRTPRHSVVRESLEAVALSCWDTLSLWREGAQKIATPQR